jgi:hypothetical protein
MRKDYATALTRDYLEYLGITDVSKDGKKIMKGESEVPQHSDGRYYNIRLYDAGIRRQTPKDKRCTHTGQIYFGVHRVVWAWHNRIAPNGFVIDHINNDKTDNRLDNLQLFTPQQNINKDKAPSTRQLKCKLNKPRSFYEEKLEEYMAEYEAAKLTHDAKKCHHLRCNIANTQARLRYWDAHSKEAPSSTKTDKELLKTFKERFKAEGKKDMWHYVVSIEKAWPTYDTFQRDHIINTLIKHFE